MFPEGCTEYASRAPPRTQVSDASGQLLKVNSEVSMTIYVGGAAMEHEFFVVKALSVPLISGRNFQRNHVDTISPKSLTIKWDDGTSAVAMRSWMGNTRPASPRRGIKPKAQAGAIRLRRGVTVDPPCIQAVQVCCNVEGVHLVRERQVKMSRRQVLLRNAVAEFSPTTPRSVYLTNIGDEPVHLTKGYVIGTATVCDGPLHVVQKEEDPGAVLTMGADPRHKPDEDVKTGRQAEEGIDEGQSPRHPQKQTCRKPEVQWDGVPGTLRGAVDDFLEEYKALWAGQLDKVDVIPHQIEVTRGHVHCGPNLIERAMLRGTSSPRRCNANGTSGLLIPRVQSGPSRWSWSRNPTGRCGSAWITTNSAR